MVGLNVNQKEFIISVVCKNVVENFVTIALLVKESMILLREAKSNFMEQNY